MILTVHPHRRGEHKIPGAGSKIQSGSSPQAWGTLAKGMGLTTGERFIPTGVGNTSSRRSIIVANTVHPHRRGEHRYCLNRLDLRTGSSPQAWGTLYKISFYYHGLRFIPTGVGNTARHRSIFCRHPVHPHRRGEHFEPGVLFAGYLGSSPQAWGTQQAG